MKLNDLVAEISHTANAPLTVDITAIVYDSRKAAPGTLFVCLVGAWLDGHTYAASAYQNGCRAFLVEHPLPDLPADAVQVVTDNTRAALAVIGAAFYGHPAQELHIVGITGTKGKTTTAIMTAALLNAAGKPCGYIGSNGVDYAGVHEKTANTTPESLELQRIFRAMVTAGITHLVMEVSSQALDHHRVDGVPFETVAFTNLSEDHIGTGEHASFADYKAAKRRLFAEFNAQTMVFNADDAASAEMAAAFTGPVRRSYGLHTAAADYRAVDIELFRTKTAMGVQFTCCHDDAKTPISLHSPGDFTVYNALCAIALSAACGVPPQQVAGPLAALQVKGRFEVVGNLPHRTFLIDYAHNGLSLETALKTLRRYNPHRLICVFGTVGGQSQNRREDMALAAGYNAGYSIITTDNPNHEPPENIIRDIAAHMPEGAKFECITDRGEAITAAVKMAQEGDIVLFAGKGHEDYQLIDGVKQPFCERALIEAACAARLPELG